MSSKFSRINILSATLAPPIRAASGLFSSCISNARPRDRTSRSVNKPIAEGNKAGTPTVEAWARWATAKASITKQSAGAAKSRAKLGSLASSPGENRRFSSNITSPGLEAETAPSTLGPVLSWRHNTGVPRRDSSRAPTGASRRPSTTCPLGRPRWEHRMTRQSRSRRC